MTFEDKLGRARTGSRAAYESLCLGSVDKLYTAALISLRNEKEARAAVISAVNDGFSGISKIKDERHLRSWLVHELTKTAVDKLKEFKAGGTSYTQTGVFADTGRLPDVERLVFAVATTFGYGERELSVLTGMSGETVSAKLASAKQRLGASYGSVREAVSSYKAPDSLREKYSGFDEAIAKMEAPKPEPVPEPEPPQEEQDSLEDIAVSPVDTAVLEMPEPVTEPEDSDESVFTDDSPTSDTDGGDDDEYEPDDYADSDDDEQVFELDEPETPEQPEQPSEMTLNAETFIAVVSAERMKGSEFLRLIGNTRISNSAYREIEQNPRLTKKRLIELLEQSQLTENDYYKLLTAIKDRREVLDAKEENRLTLERAGLYDGSRRARGRRKRREKPKTDLEMAIGITDSKPVQALTFEKSKLPENDLDYQLLNSKGTFSHPGYYHDHRVTVKEDKTSLEAVVKPEVKEPAPENPMSNSALHDLFDEHNDEPIDPFAAIAANETGEPSMPGRLDTQKEEWDKAHAEQAAAEQKDEHAPHSLTVEFEAAKTAEITVDTRQFDAVAPGAAEPEKPSEPAPTGYDPFASGDDVYKPDFSEQPEITTVPVQDNISVTQIIREHAIGENVTDEQADRSLGLSPFNTGLVFAAAKKEKTDTGMLEFSLPEAESKDQGAYAPDLNGISDKPAEPSAPYEPKAPEASEAPEEPEVPEAPAVPEEPEEPEEPYAPYEPYEPQGVEDSEEYSDADEVFDAASEEEEEISPVSPMAQEALPVDIDPGTDLPGDDDDDEEDDDDEGSFDEAPRRRYKGNEFFYDDNEFYEGVNRGKIAACAVFAALLIAGSVGMRFLPVGTNDAAAVTEPTVSESGSDDVTAEPETSPEDEFTASVSLVKLSSLSELSSEYEDGGSLVVSAKTEYLNASGAPYDTELVTDIGKCGAVFTDTTAYVCSRSGQFFSAVKLDGSTEPEAGAQEDTESTEEASESTEPAKLRVNTDGIYAFTAVDGDLYIVCAPEAGVNTRVLVYDDTLVQKAEYSLSGIYCGAGRVNGRLVIATCSSETDPYYTENGERHDLAASDIYAIEGAKHGAVHQIWSVGSGKPLAIAGGLSYGSGDPHVKFTSDGITLVAADGDVTYTVDISDGLVPSGAHAYKGCAFSAVCAGYGGMIGADPQTGITAYKNGHLVTVPDVTPVSAAWSDKGVAYVVTRNNDDGQKMLYGFDMSGDEPVNASITADDIYTSVLRGVNGSLAGIKAEPAPDGERAGLRLSLYKYDGKLIETAYSIIELDRATARENLKYLSSPAETDIAMLAADESGTLFAVPTVYFDGFSEVERVVVLSFDGTTFSQINELVTYDEKSSILCPFMRDGKVYVITDEKLTEIPLESE